MKRKEKKRKEKNFDPFSNKRLRIIGKYCLRYSTRHAIHMAALQTRKLVGLTVGLPVSVRCILTLFARHFFGDVPVFSVLLRFILPFSPIYHPYVIPRTTRSTPFGTETNFSLIQLRLVPTFAFCLLFYVV